MRRIRVSVAVAVLMLLAAAGCSARDESESTAENSAALPADDVDAEAREEAAAADQAAPAPAGGGVGEGFAPLPDASGAQDRVIKEGTITLEVEAGTFDAAFREVIQTADQFQGAVAGSTTRTQEDGGGTFGSVTVRVPAQNYEELLVEVSTIGTVRSSDVTSSDVSTEFVDLQARQRNLEAQERFYLELLEGATGVSDAIAIQQQLTGITEQLEQVKGRIAYLDDRTTYSTLTVELFEPGAAPPTPVEPASGPSLARFWQLAQDAFVNVVGLTLVVAAFLAPIALLGLAVLGIWRIVSHRPAPARRSTPEPERERERESAS